MEGSIIARAGEVSSPPRAPCLYILHTSFLTGQVIHYLRHKTKYRSFVRPRRLQIEITPDPDSTYFIKHWLDNCGT